MLITFTFLIIISLSFFAIEGFILDLISLLKKLKPKLLTDAQWNEMKQMDEKPIAIIIANWKEAEVIERMINGNMKRLLYKNFHFFIGVYPNDTETLLAAKKAESNYPHNVHVVINSENGPTSKGQMLNQIVQTVFRQESVLKLSFEIFLMHDSEDILHPRSLTVINSEISQYDFLQTPIFSFKRKFTDWVGSTYVDEFAELHTKDLLVRQALGAPVPSAGVGTAIRRTLMLSLLQNNNGHFLREDSLTEDYILGMSSAEQGFKTGFCCYYFINKKSKKELIATREYFPDHFQSAVRQKSRWVLGIVFQGSLMINWMGSVAHKYYLYRDRRGPLVNFISFSSLILSLYFLMETYVLHTSTNYFDYNWFKYGSLIAIFGLTNRLFSRIIAVTRVNGWSLEVVQIPLRWPLGVVINLVASIRALNQFQRFVFANESLKWVKTTHVLPESFGLEESTPVEEILNRETENAIEK